MVEMMIAETCYTRGKECGNRGYGKIIVNTKRKTWYAKTVMCFGAQYERILLIGTEASDFYCKS